MQALEDILSELTVRIWQTVFGLTLRRELPAARPVSGPALTGCVHMTGDWEGAVTLSCPAALGREIAAIVFGLPPDLATGSDERDALGEIANMTGGNLKAMLSERCHLSQPVVADGSDPAPLVPGTHLLCEAAFECEGHPLRVAVWKRDERDGSAGAAAPDGNRT